jgi:hypothetical protein
VRRIWAALSGLALAGCYTYTPLATLDPVPGTHMALVLSDQGRVGMGPSIGHGVARLDGALVRSSDTAYVLAVSDVLGINGGRTPWAGETVQVQRAYVANSLERRFSRGRTFLVAGGAAVAVVAFILTRNLLGIGGTDANTLPGGGGTGNQ